MRIKIQRSIATICPILASISTILILSFVRNFEYTCLLLGSVFSLSFMSFVHFRNKLEIIEGQIYFKKITGKKVSIESLFIDIQSSFGIVKSAQPVLRAEQDKIGLADVSLDITVYDRASVLAFISELVRLGKIRKHDGLTEIDFEELKKNSRGMKVRYLYICSFIVLLMVYFLEKTNPMGFFALILIVIFCFSLGFLGMSLNSRSLAFSEEVLELTNSHLNHSKK